MYVERNIDARSCNHCCHGKPMCSIFWVCVCSYRYSACNAHASYCHLWPVHIYNNIPHFLVKGTIFEKKKLLNLKCVLISSTTYIWHIAHSNTFLTLTRIERDMIKNLYSSSCKLFLSDFNGTWIFSTEFRKITNYRFHENSSSGSRVVACGQAVRHGAANSRSSQFCKRA
jgi:hypothetical protein